MPTKSGSCQIKASVFSLGRAPRAKLRLYTIDEGEFAAVIDAW